MYWSFFQQGDNQWAAFFIGEADFNWRIVVVEDHGFVEFVVGYLEI